MLVTWTTRDSRTHHIRLGLADYGIADLVTFQRFFPVIQFCFAEGGSPWLPAGWFRDWFDRMNFQLEMEKDVLPFRYGANGDFGGSETVIFRGEQWSLTVGSGECSLSQAVAYERSISEQCTVAGSRISKWIDLRGQSRLEADGRVIKLQRKKHEYRWYAELPGLLRFLAALRPDEEVRTFSRTAPVNTQEIIRIADEEPGGFDAAAEILADQGEKALLKLSKALDDPRNAERQTIVKQLLSLAQDRIHRQKTPPQGGAI